jgi:type IV pilus assembly protein PilE
MSNRVRKGQGFTLIELMTAIVIIAILAAVAIPSYQQYIVRGNRAAAQSQMLDIANRQQQIFLANRAYSSKTAFEAAGYALPNDVSSRYTYDIALSTGAVPFFMITFRPTGGQASDGDLVITSEGVKTPSSKW